MGGDKIQTWDSLF